MPKPRGGYREGGGRPKGSLNKKTHIKRELEKVIDSGGISPLEHMLAVLHDPATAQSRKDEMARAAAPYLHPKPIARDEPDPSLATITGDIRLLVIPSNHYLTAEDVEQEIMFGGAGVDIGDDYLDVEHADLNEALELAADRGKIPRELRLEQRIVQLRRQVDELHAELAQARRRSEPVSTAELVPFTPRPRRIDNDGSAA